MTAVRKEKLMPGLERFGGGVYDDSCSLSIACTAQRCMLFNATCTFLQAQLVKIQEHQAHIEQQLDGVKSHLLELEQQEGFTELD